MHESVIGHSSWPLFGYSTRCRLGLSKLASKAQDIKTLGVRLDSVPDVSLSRVQPRSEVAPPHALVRRREAYAVELFED